MKLRRFTPEGIQAFREFLATCRRQPDTEVPSGLLEHRTLTEVVSPECQVAHNHFETKGDAARYLHSALARIAPEDLVKDAGLWTWLSLLYFDSVCQTDSGRRVVRADYHYLFEPLSVRYYYCHLLFISWRVLQLAPSHNRLFLRSRLDTRDNVTTEVMKRLFLTRIPAIFELLDRVYWDEKAGRPRQGKIGGQQPGSLRYRLPVRIRQLEKTYDLMSLTTDQLLELLGDEFAFARPKARRLFMDEAVS